MRDPDGPAAKSPKAWLDVFPEVVPAFVRAATTPVQVFLSAALLPPDDEQGGLLTLLLRAFPFRAEANPVFASLSAWLMVSSSNKPDNT